MIPNLKQSSSVLAASLLPDPIPLGPALKQPIELPPELIPGLLRKGELMMMSSGAKAYKTWSLIDLAFAVAEGKPWWNFETKQGRVLVINLELHDAVFAWRAREIAAAKRAEVADALLAWNLRDHISSWRILLPALETRLDGQQFDLLIIDPIYRILGDTNENSNDELTQLLNRLNQFAVKTGAAVIFCHHFSKGNQASKDHLDRGAGGGAWARYCDTILTVTKHEEDSAYTVEATTRSFAPIEPFVVRREHPLMILDDELDPSALQIAGAKKKKAQPEDLLELLQEGERVTKKEFYNRAKNANVPGSEKTIQRLLVSMVKSGLFEANQYHVFRPSFEGEKGLETDQELENAQKFKKVALSFKKGAGHEA